MEASNELKIAIFASGRGSNAKNIFEFIKLSKQNNLTFRITASCLITDNVDAPVIQVAKDYEIPCFVIAPVESKKEHEQKIIECLNSFSVDYICLCGYMRILSEAFINNYSLHYENHSRIINIHPSLLPLFPGKDGYGDAFAAKTPESGVTIHFVDKGVDTGPIILQKKFKRQANDTLVTFKNRGLKLEYIAYQELLTQLNNHGDIKL